MQKNFKFVDHGFKFPSLADNTTENGRWYTTPDGNVYPSVTTVLGTQEKPHLIEWKKKVGEERAKQILFQASIRGTAIHTICEEYINGTYHKTNHMSLNVATFQSIRPIIDNNINNVWAQEVGVYSDRLKVAGRTDLLAEWKNELAVIDFKSSLRIKDEDQVKDYFMQESVYAACLYEMFGIIVKKIVTIMAVDNEEPIVFEKEPFQYLRPFIVIRNNSKL